MTVILNLAETIGDNNEGGVILGSESESEEALESRGLAQPCKPSQEEVERHMRTHLPFRRWCEICVRGRAQGNPHQITRDREETTIPVIAIDYGYLIEGYMRDLRGNGIGKPILVIKDDKTKAIATHTVPKKGGDAYAINALVHEIDANFGYKRVIPRSDQEPAILGLKTKVKKLCKTEIIFPRNTHWRFAIGRN